MMMMMVLCISPAEASQTHQVMVVQFILALIFNAHVIIVTVAFSLT